MENQIVMDPAAHYDQTTRWIWLWSTDGVVRQNKINYTA